jgi:hypothetical protein
MELPMLHKMFIERHKVSSDPFPPPAQYFPFSYLLFWKLADRYKCAQPIGEIISTPPLSLRIVDYRVDYEIRRGYSQLQRRVPPYTMVFFEYSLRIRTYTLHH